jgi:hypothetical protein
MPGFRDHQRQEGHQKEGEQKGELHEETTGWV